MLTWNVYIGDFNSREIEVYNVLEGGRFVEDCRRAAKKFRDSREAFEKEVRSSLMYCYWSKCEWEIVLQHWPHNERFRDKKVDVFEQVCLNWPVFIDYLWEHRKEI